MFSFKTLMDSASAASRWVSGTRKAEPKAPEEVRRIPRKQFDEFARRDHFWMVRRPAYFWVALRPGRRGPQDPIFARASGSDLG